MSLLVNLAAIVTIRVGYFEKFKVLDPVLNQPGYSASKTKDNVVVGRVIGREACAFLRRVDEHSNIFELVCPVTCFATTPRFNLGLSAVAGSGKIPEFRRQGFVIDLILFCQSKVDNAQ